MTGDPLPFRARLYPTGFLTDHPPMRSEEEVAAEIAARQAAEERERRIRMLEARGMKHLLPHAPSLARPGAQLRRPTPDAPSPRRPTIKPVTRASLFERLFGRRA